MPRGAAAPRAVSGRHRAGRRRRPTGRRLALAAVATGLLLLATTVLGLSLTSAANPATGSDRSLDRMVRYLQETQRRDGCFPMTKGGNGDPAYASSWTAIALAAAGVNPREQFRPDGYRSVLQCIRGAVRTLRVTTDYERVLLVVNAAGVDPHDFGGVDLVTKILIQQRPDGSFTHDPAKPAAGVNTTIWAVLALAPVAEPEVRAAVRRAARWIVAAQSEDGGWPAVVAGMMSSTDMTGAALQALRAAGMVGGTREDPAAAAARDRAVAFLRGLQLSDGGFADLPGKTESNSASTAWVAQGLWAIGKSPARWKRGANSMLTYLASLQKPDGSVLWTANKDMNPVWMTAYTAPAYSGRYLPLARVPYTGRVPDPRNKPSDGDGGEGIGGGSGGTGGKGGGVLAGGGGNGAPTFSRPRQGSKGSTVGGVTKVETERRRTAPRPERSQQQQDDDPGEPVRQQPSRGSGTRDPTAPAGSPGRTSATPSTPETGGASSFGRGTDAARGLRDGLQVDADRAAATTGDGGEEISGVVVGGGEGDATNGGDPGAAFGLRSAAAGGDSGPWLATGIAGALLLTAGLGGLLERRRPGLDLTA